MIGLFRDSPSSVAATTLLLVPLVAALVPGLLVALGGLMAVLEEMLFRGLVLRSFLRRYPKWQAIGFSAILFGALALLHRLLAPRPARAA